MDTEVTQPADRWTPTSNSPVQKKDWVMEKDVQHPLLGCVKDVYWDGTCQQWVMDLVLYSADGTRVGRQSPAMGGPRSFEPALTCECYNRINKPRFPIQLDGTGYRDWRDGVTVIPDRT